MKLEVVTIGTELVLGQIVNTNAAELGRALAGAGVEVVRQVSVADRPEAIRAAIAEVEAEWAQQLGKSRFEELRGLLRELSEPS